MGFVGFFLIFFSFVMLFVCYAKKKYLWFINLIYNLFKILKGNFNKFKIKYSLKLLILFEF